MHDVGRYSVLLVRFVSYLGVELWTLQPYYVYNGFMIIKKKSIEIRIYKKFLNINKILLCLNRYPIFFFYLLVYLPWELRLIIVYWANHLKSTFALGFKVIRNTTNGFGLEVSAIVKRD
jgi:hypothetical protein